MKVESFHISLLALAILFSGAAPAGADSIYVMDFYGAIEQFDSNNGDSSVFASAPGESFGMAFDTSGNLYVSSYWYNAILKLKYSPWGVVTTFATTGINHPFDIAFDHSGNLYVANSGNVVQIAPGEYQDTSGTGSIVKYNSHGVGTTIATGLGYPFGMAVDSRGNIYLANAGGSSYAIFKFSPNGTESLFAGPLNYGPQGLAFDSSDNLYVADASGGRIMKYSPTGVGTVFVSGLSQPINIAFDSSDNLYVADSDADMIIKYNQNGVGSVFATFSDDFSIPLGIAVQPANRWNFNFTWPVDNQPSSPNHH
jgi:sugar lactone lactonase YvrE